jgi:hypothetical protein
MDHREPRVDGTFTVHQLRGDSTPRWWSRSSSVVKAEVAGAEHRAKAIQQKL